ncbi:UNVERIFIED_CONTAM: hypothetical protein GTU68_029445, partial [Idotea baltica]|nr:hypothetical protein [Idotea baltica]
MEMGFARNSVEHAVRSLGGSVDDSHLSPEAVVVWLIEHAESTMGESLFPVEPVDSDADSLTDEFVDEALQLETSPGSEGFMQRSDFSSAEDYAIYVRDHIHANMMVRCIRTYEEVYEGDVGRVLRVDKGSLHALNVQVHWQRKGGTYLVRFIHVELLENGPGPLVPNCPIKVGDRVRVKASVDMPKYKWGYVNH